MLGGLSFPTLSLHAPIMGPGSYLFYTSFGTSCCNNSTAGILSVNGCKPSWVSFSWYSGPATMSAMKFPVSSNVHVSLAGFLRSTCALTFSMCAPVGRCRWHAMVMLLCVRDWTLPCTSCMHGLNSVIAAWQSDNILCILFVCFCSARSIHSANNSIGNAEWALMRCPSLMCIAIVGYFFQSGLSA